MRKRLYATVVILSACLLSSSCSKQSSTTNNEDSVEQETLQHDIKTGDIDISKEKDIDITKLNELLQKMRDKTGSKTTVGELDTSGTHVYVHGGYNEDSSSAEDVIAFTITEDNKIQTDVRWTDGVLDEISLECMRAVATELLTRKLNKSESDRYVVEQNIITPEETDLFDEPVFYYVTSDGVLYLNMSLTIYDVKTKKQKETLTTMGIRHTVDSVELVL